MSFSEYWKAKAAKRRKKWASRDKRFADNHSQMEEIRKGLKSGVDISLYASPDIPYEKMRQLRKGLEEGINLSTNTPLCSLNKDYVETLKFLHDLGVRYVTCSGLIITGNATRGWRYMIIFPSLIRDSGVKTEKNVDCFLRRKF